MTSGVKILREILDNPEIYTDILTINDFFDCIDLAVEHRTDFAFACYLKQALEENSVIESSGKSEPTHNNDLNLYLVTLEEKGTYKFLIKAQNLLVALGEFYEYLSNTSRDFTVELSSINIRMIRFIDGAVIQV